MMKMSMQKKNTGKGQYRLFSLFPLLLILTVLPFFMSSCCSDDTSTPQQEKPVVLVFGVDQGEGTLNVKIVPGDSKRLTDEQLKSPMELKKGTKVRFEVLHSKSFQVKYWKINGTIIRSVDPVQTLTINEHTDVRVALKPWQP